jgi:signal peptidase I
MRFRILSFCCLILCITAGCGLNKYVSLRHVIPATNSMAPTIEIGDHVGASRIGSGELFLIERFDIVLYKHPPDPKRKIDENTLFIHRVIGLPGEKVEIKKGVVYINDQPLDESSFQSNPSNDDHKPVIVPVDEYYLLGDNRPNAEDSRFVGTVKKSDIDSIATTIIRKADYDGGKRW